MVFRTDRFWFCRWWSDVGENVYLYSDNNFSTKLFEIPYGYFLKVENVNGEVVRVSYGEDNDSYPVIMGYCKYSELSTTTITPIKPFTPLKVSTSISDVLFNNSEQTKAYFNVPENTFMIYYGKIVLDSGNTLAYVYCNNKLGYFDINSLNPFSIPENPDPIPQPPKNDNEIEPDVKDENKTTSQLPAESLQIIIIVGLSIICISIVYALFKPHKIPTQDHQYIDE